MNKLILLSALSASILSLGQCFHVSLDRTNRNDYSLYTRGLRDKTLLERRPELRDAPAYHISLDVAEDRSNIRALERVRIHDPGRAVDFVLLPNIAPNTLSPGSVQVDGEAAATRLSEEGIRLQVSLPVRDRLDGSAVVSIPYTIRLPQSTAVGFGGLETAADAISLGYFYPMIPASGVWPYGKPAAHGDLTANPVSFYLVDLSYPEGLDLVSPGTVLSSETRQGRTGSLVAFGPARDLLFMLGKGLRRTSRFLGPVELRAAVPPAAQATADRVLAIAARALPLFERIFGPYPYRSLTFVEARFDAYGLEFPSTILLTSRIFDEGLDRVDGVPRSTLIESVVVHEIAHQWFYALVGNDQLAEPWIDEGFAQYATYRYYRERYGEGAAAGFLGSLDGRIARAGGQPLPIGRPVAGYTPRDYSAAIYGRAPYFLLALEERMGRARFDHFLLRLVSDYSWRTVSGAQIKRELEESCDCSLDEMWKSWVEGEKTAERARLLDQHAP